jgi:IMP dehydrogenase
MKILPYEGLGYNDICLVPRYTEGGRNGDISSGQYSSPIIMSPMLHTCTPEMIDYFINNGMCPTVHRYFESAKKQMEHIRSIYDCETEPFFAVGTLGRWKNWIDVLIGRGVRSILIDVAHGDCKQVVDTIKYIKDKNSAIAIMAGNVAMADGFVELEAAGADYIRVGIASGACCSTYLNTGVGTPIVTSLIEVHKVRRNAKIIADGGIKHPGDIAKAMAVGADFVMIGSLLAGTSMAAGPFYDCDKHFETNSKNIKWAEYAGMASAEARATINNGLKNSSIEGVSGLVKYNGFTDTYIDSIHDNLRAAMGYLGSNNWKKFNQKAKVMKLSIGGQYEKGVHLK